MRSITLFWLVFAALFGCFSVYHFVQLFHSVPHFEWDSPKSLDVEFYNGIANENKFNLTKFVAQWNEYVDRQNTSSFWINLIAAVSYMFTAALSYKSYTATKSGKKGMSINI